MARPRPVMASVLLRGMIGAVLLASSTSTLTQRSRSTRTVMGASPCRAALVTSSLTTSSASAATSGGRPERAERTNRLARGYGLRLGLQDQLGNFAHADHPSKVGGSRHLTGLPSSKKQ